MGRLPKLLPLLMVLAFLLASAPLLRADGDPVVTTASLPDGEVTVAYSASLEASGGTPPYTWSITGGGLPPSLTLAGAIIGGTPTSPDTYDHSYSFQVTVTDNAGRFGSRWLSIRVVYGGPVIGTSSLPDGEVTVPYSQALSVTGGTPPYSFSTSGGALPPGLAWVGGTIAGTPTSPDTYDHTYSFQVRVTDSVGRYNTRWLSIRVLYNGPVIGDSALPDGEVTVPYSQTVTISGGAPPYTLSLNSGTLPPGLAFAGLTITGTPTSPDTYDHSYSFQLKATDSVGRYNLRWLSIRIVYGGPVIGTGTLPDGEVTVPYSQAVSVSGGTPPYTWSTAGGSLPPGLAWTGGAIAGTPTSPDTYDHTYSFQAKVTDSVGRYNLRWLSIRIVYGGPVIGTSALPDGEVSIPYSQALAASGGSPPYTWSVNSGTLPPGLAIAGEAISGTPTSPDTYNHSYSFQLRVADGVGRYNLRWLSIRIVYNGPVIGTASPLPDGEVSTAYSQALAATGGTLPYAWSVDSGSLPPGLALPSAGLLSGTPTTAGWYSFTARVTDAGGRYNTKYFSLRINDRLRITTTSLPDPSLGASYWELLSAGGGTLPYTWTVSGGTLPPGLVLSSAGVLSGTATASGTFNFEIKVTDGGGRTATWTFTLDIAAALEVSPASLSFSYQAGGALPAAQSISVTGGGSPPNFTAVASTDSGGNWLAVSPASGSPPATVSVTVAPAGLAAGTYTGRVRVSSTGATNSPQSVSVTLLVTSRPVLVLAPASLAFNSAPAGGPPAAQSLSITSSGAALAFTASAATTSGGNWLAVSPAGATTPATLSVSVSPGELGPGTYQGTVSISATDAGNSPQTAAVTLTIAQSSEITVTDIRPNQGGNTGPVTVILNGTGFVPGVTVKLTRETRPDVPAQVEVGEGGWILTARFDLAGVEPGPWDMLLSDPAGGSLKLPAAFTVLSGGEGRLVVDVVGPPTFRVGREATYDVLVRNVGTVDLQYVYVDISAQTEAPPESLRKRASAGAEFPVYGDSALLMSLPVGAPVRIPAPLTMDFQACGVCRAAAEAPDPKELSCDQVRELIDKIEQEVLPDLQGQLRDVQDEMRQTGCPNPDVPPELQLPKCKSLTRSQRQLSDRIAKVREYLARLEQQLADCQQGANEVRRAQVARQASGSVQADGSQSFCARTSWDPNDKSGPAGSGGARQLRQGIPFPYTIYFENLAGATAPAREAVVTDRLDPNLDLSTLTLGNITLGGVTTPVPEGSRQVSTVAEAPAGNQLQVRIEAALNSATRELTWRFTTLEAATGQPPQDPLAGFLPPNVIPPQGEGSVSLLVTPKTGLASGTQISNRAAITFDANPAIQTPVWVNTIDAGKPRGQVAALPPSLSSSAIPLQWSAEDAESGIRDYTVFAAEDGGRYSPWLRDTTAISGIFPGQPGKTYAFYSIARDNAGNFEDPPTSPDAVTTILAASTRATAVNAASYAPLPAPLALGSIVSIFGSGLPAELNLFAAADFVPGSDPPTLPASLAAVSVRFAGVSAPLFFAGSGVGIQQPPGVFQINCQVPNELPLGPVAVEVLHQGQVVASGAAELVRAAPGVFTLTQSGTGQAAALNQDYSLNGDPDHPLLPATHPKAAARGQAISVYATGTGWPLVDYATGRPANPATGQIAPCNGAPLYATRWNPTATVGGKPARVLFSGLAPCFVGLWQVNIEIPADAPTGVAVPLAIQMQGQTSNTATVAIQ